MLRTKPDPESTSREVTWQCRNPACQTVFVTWEQVTRILADPATSPTMRSIAEILGRMDRHQLQQVQAYIERV